MKKFLRRKNDRRETWSDERRDEATSLIIPPCDLWQGPEEPLLLQEIATPINEEIKSQEVLDKPSRTVTAEAGDPASQCWAFTGATGGVGTTSLAVQFAYELSKQISQFGRGVEAQSGPLVCLIDLDFEAGKVAHYLDVQSGITHADLTKDASKIDESFAQSLFVEHKSGISVLAAPNKLGANQEVNPAAVIALLEIACDMFPYVILDLPQHWQSWSLAALGGSDFVGLVSDFTIPSLNAAREKRAQIAQKFNNGKSCDFVLNKFERRYLKSSIRLPDAKKALKSDIFGTVCFEPEVAIEALNCGSPIGAVRPSSRIAKDCEGLLDKILEMTYQEQDQLLLQTG